MNIRTFINLTFYRYRYGSSSSNQDRNKGTTDRDTERSRTYKGRSTESCRTGKGKGRSCRLDKGSKGRQDGSRALSLCQAVLQLRRKAEGARKESSGRKQAYFLGFSPFLFFNTPLDYQIDSNLFPQGFIILFLIFGFGYLLSRKLDIQTVINAIMDNKTIGELRNEDNN